MVVRRCKFPNQLVGGALSVSKGSHFGGGCREVSPREIVAPGMFQGRQGYLRVVGGAIAWWEGRWER